jgi:DNA-binding MarR family transcriptional regulator
MTRPAPIDLSDVSGCTCLSIRRIARRLTQAYDRALEKAELTVNQFGLLAKLYGASSGGQKGVPIGAFADRVGMHPTTLNRDLKALKARQLVSDASDPGDRRVRCVTITKTGCAALRGAIPLWRKAQTALELTLGKDARALSKLLDAATRKLESAAARI